MGQKTIWTSSEYLGKLSDADLGKMVKDYLRDSIHGSWEGFSSRDLTGISRFLEDAVLYHKATDYQILPDNVEVDNDLGRCLREAGITREQYIEYLTQDTATYLKELSIGEIANEIRCGNVGEWTASRMIWWWRLVGTCEEDKADQMKMCREWLARQ